MNKKGFSLVELIVVVSIMAVVALIATPSIIDLTNNSKKEQVISDAKKFISDVKYKSKLMEYENYYPNKVEGSYKEICSKEDIFSESLPDEVDGKKYDRNESCVKVIYENGEYNYYIKLATKDNNGYNRGISTSEDAICYVHEDNINKETSVKYSGFDYAPSEEACNNIDIPSVETYICGCLSYNEYEVYNTYEADSCIRVDEVCTNESCNKTTCSKVGGTDSDTWNIEEQIATCSEYKYCER